VNWLTALRDHIAARSITDVVERTLAPVIKDARARLGCIPDHAWRDPYAVGFLATLITLTAASVRRLGPQALALVQVDAWQRLTRIEDDSVGERICLLALSHDPSFLSGCLDASRYFEQQRQTDVSARPHATGVDVEMEGYAADSGSADYIWSKTIESHLGALIGPEDPILRAP
jgi:hypothetical protein